MSIDRQRLEQEALQFISKGQNEKALERYVTLLKAEPRDLRLRQQVADLYLKLSRNPEAEKHLREIAKQLRAGGKDRMAIGVYKQVIRLKPDEAALYVEMGDCYGAASLPQDAKASWTKAVEMLARTRPDQAVEVVEKLIRLDPGDMPLKVRLAELCEAANWGERSSKEWRKLAQEARRLGRIEDRARFAEQALRRRPDDLESLSEAADARNAMGEYELALKHLQRALQQAPEALGVLRSLGEALDGLGAKDKARSVWREVARVAHREGDPEGRAAALRRAAEAGETDPAVLAELAEAQRLAERAALRLTDQAWAEPTSPTELALWARARTLAQYGFAERARVEVERTGSRALSLLVLLAELRAEVGDGKGAAQVLRALNPSKPEAIEQIGVRISVLEGRDALGLPSRPASPAPADDDELLEDEPTGGGDEDELLDDDALDEGMVEELDEDGLVDEGDGEGDGDAGDDGGWPTDDGLEAEDDPPTGGADEDASWSFLDEPAPAAAAPDLAADLFADVLGPPAAPSASAPRPAPAARPLPVAVEDAFALLLVGALDAAEAAAKRDRTLHGERALAAILERRGDAGTALRGLQDALDESAEADPGYAEALLALAALNIGAGKARRAQRQMDEAADLLGAAAEPELGRLRRAMALLGL